MRFVGKYKFIIFDETIYYNEDTIIANIIDRVFKFKQFDDKVYDNRTLSLFKYR